MTKTYKVTAFWDEEASVWVAEGENLPGLVTEAPTIEALMKKLDVMIPDLLEARGELQAGGVPFELIAHASSVAHA